MTTSKLHHFLHIEGGNRPTAVCTAPAGAPCHMACPTCEECCTCGKPREDMGECNWCLWLNNDDIMECGEDGGVAELAIDVQWNGDNYGWSFIAPEVTS